MHYYLLRRRSFKLIDSLLRIYIYVFIEDKIMDELIIHKGTLLINIFREIIDFAFITINLLDNIIKILFIS